MKTKKEVQETQKADSALKGAATPAEDTGTAKAPGKRRGRPKVTEPRELVAEADASPSEAAESTGTSEPAEPRNTAIEPPVSPTEAAGSTETPEPHDTAAEPDASLAKSAESTETSESHDPAAASPADPAGTALAKVPTLIEPLTKEQLKIEYRKRTGIIKEQLNSIQQSFLVIAFQLFWIKENVMYPSAYKNIYEFADVEYGISRSTCGNLIYIVDTYAERDGNGRVLESLQERYRNFSASQLVAMAGMPEEVREKVKPDMSVRMINRMRKQEAQARLGYGRDVDAVPEKKEPAEPQTTAGTAAEKGTGEPSGHMDAALEKGSAGTGNGAAAGKDTQTAGSVPIASGTAPGQDEHGSPMPDGTAAEEDGEGQDGQGRPEPAQRPGAQQENLKVFSTLLSFTSYSRYEKEQEYLRTLIKNVFDDNSGAVTVKVIYEKEPA